MITSKYDDVFDLLVRKLSVRVPAYTINFKSMQSAFYTFRKQQYGADWLKFKVINVSIDLDDPNYVNLTLVDSRNKPIPIIFTTATSSEPSYEHTSRSEPPTSTS